MNTYKTLLNNIVLNNIKNWPMDKPFALREVLPNPQALWGHFFHDDVVSGVVPNVEPLYIKDKANASLYQRV